MKVENSLPAMVYNPEQQLILSKDNGDFQGYASNPRCNKCYGRGWTGKMVVDENRIHILCGCIKKVEGSLVCGIRW
jgi:hypothetical protein